jgi:hypothetical protein
MEPARLDAAGQCVGGPGLEPGHGDVTAPHWQFILSPPGKFAFRLGALGLS